MNYLLLAFIAVFSIPLSLFGQPAHNSSKVSVSFSIDHYPQFRLNTTKLGPATSYGVGGVFYNPEVSPLEFGAHLTAGYTRSIGFSYGFSFAYVTNPQTNQFLKIGFSLDRIEMKDYRMEYVVGGVIEDDTHESLQPFLEWELMLSKEFSFKLKANYRLMRSETEHVVEKVSDEIFDDGTTLEHFKIKYSQSYYGVGFNMGAGFQINF